MEEQTVAAERDAFRLRDGVDVALDVGTQILISEGEISRVEDTVSRISRAYGAERVDVFAITSLIVISVADRDGNSMTLSRRIYGNRKNMRRVEEMNALSRRICADPVSPAEAKRLFGAAMARSAPVIWMRALGAILVCCSFTAFFGGSMGDCLAAVLVGCLIGAINGTLIARSKLPAFIVTLGMMKICRSVTQQCMQTVAVKVPTGFLAIANTKIGGETLLPILYWLIIAAILYVVSKHTPFGRQIYAIGSNERTARLSGVNVEKVKTWIYVLMGALVSVTAVIQIARIGSMDYANAGSGYEMDAIAAVVVGGTSMAGGKGSIIGTVLGMLIIAVMNNLLNLIGVPPFLREAFKGIIVIGAVLLQKKEKAS